MNARLVEKIEKYKSMTKEELAEVFACKPSEICMGDYIAKNTNHKVCPYKVIMGFANFEGSEVESLGKLEIVFGRRLRDGHGDIHDTRALPIYLGLNLKNSKVKNFGKVKKIYGTLSLNEYIETLADVVFLGSNLVIINSNLKSFGNLEIIDGTLSLEDDSAKCLITSLEKIKKIRKLIIKSKTLQDVGDVEEIKELITSSKCSKEIIRKFENDFIRTGSRLVSKKVVNISV